MRGWYIDCMTRRIIIMILTTLFCASCATTHDSPNPPTTRCFEDMPCFDCNTMGNGLCSADDSTPFEP